MCGMGTGGGAGCGAGGGLCCSQNGSLAEVAGFVTFWPPVEIL